MQAQDEVVIQKVRDHHAALVANLERLTGAVAQAANLAELGQALASLLQYWRHEIMPHAAAEESTIYAAATPLEAARVLISALEHEHNDLRRRAAVLEDLYAQARNALRSSASATAPAGGPTLFVQATVEAAGAEAVFAVHADKENDFVLPTLADAGRPLPEILSRMEQAFCAARRAAETAGVPS